MSKSFQFCFELKNKKFKIIEMISESIHVSSKIALIGPSAVGKTSIIQRFTRNTFEQINPTLNGSCIKQDVFLDKNVVTLEIWDTAGQEKYRSLGPLFYRDAVLCVAVFDLTSQDTFDQLPEYIGDYKDCGAGGKIFICGNKLDSVDIDNCPLLDKAKKYAESNEYGFYLTSAKNGTGITELFTDIASHLLSINHQGVDDPLVLNQNSKKKCC